MSVERALESWEGVQRQGHDIAERFTSLAHGLGCMLQSQLSSSGTHNPTERDSTLSSITFSDRNANVSSNSPWQWPWIAKPQFEAPAGLHSIQGDWKGMPVQSAEGQVPEDSFSFSQGAAEIGQRLGQAGADFRACVSGFVHHVGKQLCAPFNGEAELQLAAHPPPQSEAIVTLKYQGDYMNWEEVDEAGPSTNKGRVTTWKRNNNARHRRSDELHYTPEAGEIEDVSNEELFAFLNKRHGRAHKQGSLNMTTTFNSRTQEVESSVVARGDLWRAEVSHGGNSSANGPSPLFLLQIGPILFVRDTTLLLPIHLSKQHLLWYGFDRKNGLHSLCPAVWSKHRRWLMMSMICINPLTCTFMDLQFPNGQLTYVAGEGLTSSAFFPIFGGLLQAQSRQPGDSKISFSKKMSWGTEITPSIQLPEKSISLGVTQPLAWHRSGVMVKPRVQLSVTPTFGGRNAGWRAELSHSPKEKLSWACGCVMTIQPTAYVSVSVGTSKQKGGYSGSTGVVLVVETPMENPRRASFTVQLNNDVEF